MVSYVYRDGARLTPYMLYQIERLNADFKKRWGCEIKVTWGIRTHQEQINIFLQRYVTAANVKGRKVYDTRVWNGVRYYRISAAGTVAVPGYSNHEIQGNVGAVDLRDTGSDAGVATWGSARANWLAANAATYDMDWEGKNFGEAWHYRCHNIFKAVPGETAGGRPVPISKETKVVKIYNREDASLKQPRNLIPGGGFWLKNAPNQPTSQADNIVGGIGPYMITVHVYAEGAEGDEVSVQLFWDDTKTAGPHSGHFAETFTIGKSKLLRKNVTFQRQVPAGYAVYAQMTAPKTNSGPIKVTRFATDATLFSV